jgi:hypothetical protein
MAIAARRPPCTDRDVCRPRSRAVGERDQKIGQPRVAVLRHELRHSEATAPTPGPMGHLVSARTRNSREVEWLPKMCLNVAPSRQRVALAAFAGIEVMSFDSDSVAGDEATSALSGASSRQEPSATRKPWFTPTLQIMEISRTSHGGTHFTDGPAALGSVAPPP